MSSLLSTIWKSIKHLPEKTSSLKRSATVFNIWEVQCSCSLSFKTRLFNKIKVVFPIMLHMNCVMTELKESSCVTKEKEAKRINQMFSTEPSKLYSQCRGINMAADPSRLETEHYWKNILEHHITTQWLVDLRADHNNLPEQDPVTIATADIQERVSSTKS